MGTINYLYDPGQAVYVIPVCDEKKTEPPFISPGEVIRVQGEVLVSGTEVKYDIRLEGFSGTEEFDEADVFPDKATALVEYGTRIP